MMRIVKAETDGATGRARASRRPRWMMVGRPTGNRSSAEIVVFGVFLYHRELQRRPSAGVFDESKGLTAKSPACPPKTHLGLGGRPCER